jgi:hypothetical protein
MAKNKKKTIEVKEKVEKISAADLSKLQEIANKINGLHFNIGRIESQKHNLLHELALGQDTIKLSQEEMMDKYGSYDINLTDGTINWPKEEKSDEK